MKAKYIDWDDYFMSMVYLIASKSKDERTHIGAVVVGPDREILSTGYNSFPRGINDEFPGRQEKPEKFYWFVHAERNVIYNSSLTGVSLKGCKMYTNGIPCADCAHGIIQAGITEVIIDKNWSDDNGTKWAEHAKRTIQMFLEANIEIKYWTGELLEIHKFRRGNII